MKNKTFPHRHTRMVIGMDKIGQNSEILENGNGTVPHKGSRTNIETNDEAGKTDRRSVSKN